MGQLDPLRQQQIAIRAYRTRAEAETAVTTLAAHGIAASASVGQVDVAFPSLSFVQGHRVVVDADQVEVASALLDPPDPLDHPVAD